MIRAVAFDLDGTLLDHEGAQRAALGDIYGSLAEGLTKQPPLEEFISVWHQETERYMALYLAGELSYDQQRIRRVQGILSRWGRHMSEDEAWNEFNRYLALYERHWALFDDVQPCLHALSSRYRLGVISNGDSEQQRKKLHQTGIGRFFSSVVVSGDDRIAKPDPRIFQRSAREMDVAPDQTVFVGDNLEHDALGAVGAGMHGVWLDRKGSGLRPECVVTIANLEELSLVVNELCR